MPTMLTCEIGPGAMPHLHKLRLQHLRYIEANLQQILFGGPARKPDGSPETMVIVLRTDDRAEAAKFIEHEPYNASGVVFTHLYLQPWSQVAPPTSIEALHHEIDLEAAKIS